MAQPAGLLPGHTCERLRDMDHMGGPSKGTEPHEGVEIEEVSPSYLRITIDGVMFDVGVERVYRTHALFAEFSSLDELIEALTVLRRDVPLEALQAHMHGGAEEHDHGGTEEHEHGHGRTKGHQPDEGHKHGPETSR